MLPIPIQPMLLEKSDTPPVGNYIRQIKWDGFRCLIHYDSSKGLQLITRHGTDCTLSFPEMQKLPSTIKANVFILDGEMVVIREDGYSDWEDVMVRFQSKKPLQVQRLMKVIPATFMAFDVLWHDGQDTRKMPLEQRLELLEKIVQPSDIIQICQSFSDRPGLFEIVKERGMEGLVSKRVGSFYEHRRSSSWIKTKAYLEETVYISGIRRDPFGWSLQNKEGRYVGVCEFVGPTERKAFFPIAKQLITKETKDWIYIEPLIQGRVKFQSWTKSGLMRSPSFLGFQFQ